MKRECKTLQCTNEPHDFGCWDNGEYCKECVRRIDETADALRDTINFNRVMGYNDDGTLTRHVNGVPNGDPNAKGDIEYRRGGV